jgi:hypothetical protein
LKPYLLKGLLHFIQFEGLDNGLDFFHCISSFARAMRAFPGARRWLAGSMPNSAEAAKDLWSQPSNTRLPGASPVTPGGAD